MSGANLRIRTQIALTLGGFIFITISSIFILNYYVVRTTLEDRAMDELEKIEKSVYTATQALLSTAINNYLRGITETNLAIVESYYRQVVERKLTREQAKQQIQKRFATETVGDSGYLVAVEEKDSRIYLDLHPYLPQQECTETEGCKQWAKTRNGYTEYNWKNPLDNSSRKKAAYVVEFKPWNWIIGASSYRDEFVRLFKLDDLQKLISQIRINKSGYFFVFNSDYKLLIHPELEGIDVNQFGNDAIRQILGRLTRAGDGFITYKWKNPSETEERLKYAYVEHLEDFDWYLVASGYFDEIFAPIARLKKITTGLVCFSALLLAALIYRLSNTLSAALIALATDAKTFFQSRKQLTWEKRGIQEIDILGESLSGMTAELNTSMNTLQKKVMELAISEQEKAAGRNFIYSVIDSMPSVIIGVDARMKISLWNEKAARDSGRPLSKVQGIQLELGLPELSPHLGAILEAITDRVTRTVSYTREEENTPTRNIEMTIFPLQSSSEGGAVIRLDDVSERVEIEQRLRQSQKMDAVGQLAGGIAHDFNNMLSGIMGAAELLQLRLGEEHQQLVNIISKSAERAGELILKLLAFSRKDKVAFVPLDVHAIIEETVAILGRTLDKKVIISHQNNAALHTILGDSSQLQNSLLNLGINAGYAMTNGGELLFATRLLELDASFCEQSAFELTPGWFLEVNVRDTGCGIPVEQQKRIFEPFFTTREQGKGTGLGLAAVYGTMIQHHGAVTVYSEPGKGAEFHLLLPLSGDEIKSGKIPEISLESGQGCILVIDDEPVVRETARMLLEKLGYETMEAVDGRHGLDLFQLHQEKISLVLLDMIMPVMDGSECYRELRKLNSTVPVVISSGFSRDADLDALNEDGLAGFIRKPYKLTELSHTVASALH